MVTTIDARAFLRTRVGRLAVAAVTATMLALAASHTVSELHDDSAGDCVALVLCAAATVAVTLVIRPLGMRDRETRRRLTPLPLASHRVAVAVVAPRDAPTLAELRCLRC